jgi:hypothetical protein
MQVLVREISGKPELLIWNKKYRKYPLHSNKVQVWNYKSLNLASNALGYLIALGE